jgi:hypothetical protein
MKIKWSVERTPTTGLRWSENEKVEVTFSLTKEVDMKTTNLFKIEKHLPD